MTSAPATTDAAEITRRAKSNLAFALDSVSSSFPAFALSFVSRIWSSLRSFFAFSREGRTCWWGAIDWRPVAELVEAARC